MNLFKRLVIIMYLCVFLLIGGMLIRISLHLFPHENITEYLNYAAANPNIKWGIGIAGALIVLIGIIFTRTNLGNIKGQKAVAFKNPDGQVMVSVNAIEDYLRTIVKGMPQIKDVRLTVTASEGGLSVTIRATLLSDQRIPEVTQEIQSKIKARLSELLGIKGTINVRIYVSDLIIPKKTEIVSDQQPNSLKA